MKNFLIIGNMNAITYKEIFPLIKANELWTGVKSYSGGMDFMVGDNFDISRCKHPKYDENGKLLVNVMGCIWFTNIDHNKRNQPLDLFKKYNPNDYPKFDNYDAINVDKVANIPMDSYIEITIDEAEYPRWKAVYGDDVEIIDEYQENED